MPSRTMILAFLLALAAASPLGAGEHGGPPTGETAQAIPVRYQWDAEGRLIRKIGLEGIREYVYDGRKLIAEYNENGLMVASYAWANDRLLVIMRLGGDTYYPLFDGLGSVVGLVDHAGAVVARYRYDAWGNYQPGGSGPQAGPRFGYTGHRWEPEVGLIHADARFLDPTLGRFITPDPHPGDPRQPDTLHRYTYVRNNPLRYVDPTGLYEWDAVPGAIDQQGSANYLILPLDAFPKGVRRIVGSQDER